MYRSTFFTLATFLFASAVGGCHTFTPDAIRLNKCAEYTEYEEHVHVVTIDLRCRGLEILTTPESMRGETTTSFADKSGAQIAINGSFHTRGHHLQGLNVSNGVLLRGAHDTADRSFLACSINNRCFVDPPYNLASPRPEWRHVVAGWQPYVNGSFVCVSEADASCTVSNGGRTHPRTAIGLSASRDQLFLVVVEGRLPEYPGMTLRQLAQLFERLKIADGLNLDGGGSSTLVINGRRINKLPANQTDERKVANHFGIIFE